MLRDRLIFGILLSSVVVGLLLLDGRLAAQPPPSWEFWGVHIGRFLCNGAVCTLIVLVFTWLATRELVQFVTILGYQPLRRVAQIFAAGMVLGPYVAFNLQANNPYRDESWGMLWLALAVGAGFLLQALRRGTQHAMMNVASTTFIIFYAGLAGFMTKLRMEVGGQLGMVLLLYSMFIVKMTDVGAFFVGSAIGRHKMIPWLSPQKTWEGLVGGILVAALLSVGVGTYLHSLGYMVYPFGDEYYPWGLILFGLLMAAFSVAGDLCASLLKRDVAVKDSGQVIPGLGGVLDVLDSPLLAAPAAWFFWTKLGALITGG